MFQDRGETVDRHRYRTERAITVFEQLLADSPGTDDGPDQHVGEPVRLAQIRAAVAGSFDVYSRLFLQTFDLYEDLVQQAFGPPTETPQDAPLVVTGCPGEAVKAPFWIHNTTGADVGEVAAWMTTLTAEDGAEIAGSNGAVTPSVLTVRAGGSYEARLTVKLPMSVLSGIYHGHVLVVGLPSASLSVRLVVNT
jgi:hypothetical protein